MSSPPLSSYDSTALLRLPAAANAASIVSSARRASVRSVRTSFANPVTCVPRTRARSWSSAISSGVLRPAEFTSASRSLRAPSRTRRSSTSPSRCSCRERRDVAYSSVARETRRSARDAASTSSAGWLVEDRYAVAAGPLQPSGEEEPRTQDPTSSKVAEAVSTDSPYAVTASGSPVTSGTAAGRGGMGIIVVIGGPPAGRDPTGECSGGGLVAGEVVADGCPQAVGERLGLLLQRGRLARPRGCELFRGAPLTPSEKPAALASSSMPAAVRRLPDCSSQPQATCPTAGGVTATSVIDGHPPSAPVPPRRPPPAARCAP